MGGSLGGGNALTAHSDFLNFSLFLTKITLRVMKLKPVRELILNIVIMLRTL